MHEEDLVNDELRKIIEKTEEELFLIDPYLDAEFVWDYFVHARKSVSIRLLTSKRHLSTLLSAVGYWVERHNAKIQLRSTEEIHDRFVIVDRDKCYQISAFVTDETAKAPIAITQIIDAFTAVQNTYERLWDNANLEFPHPGM